MALDQWRPTVCRSPTVCFCLSIPLESSLNVGLRFTGWSLSVLYCTSYYWTSCSYPFPPSFPRFIHQWKSPVDWWLSSDIILSVIDSHSIFLDSCTPLIRLSVLESRLLAPENGCTVLSFPPPPPALPFPSMPLSHLSHMAHLSMLESGSWKSTH